MKKRPFIALIALFLSLSICSQLISCSTPVLAQDLMGGVEKGEVEGIKADEDFLASQREFATKIFLETHNDGENTLISPLSIMLCLSMTANGAEGESLSQLESLLGNEIGIEKLNQYLYEYTRLLPSQKGKKLEIANSIWFRDDLDVKKPFLQIGKDYYDADAYRSAFDGQTLDDINSWVNDNTDGMIQKLLDRMDPSAVMYLINALVFEGKWANKYQKDALYDGFFSAANGTKTEVVMMKSDESIYLEDSNATGFMKAYQGSGYYFAAILPKEGTTPEEYLKNAGPDGIKRLFSSKKTTRVEASLPKFKMEYSTSLIDSMKALGVTDIFDDRADLSAIADGDLYVSEVIHKTYLEVDENGSKAAAVTSAGVREMSLAPSEKEVVLDRPFLYMILDAENELPIFLGIANSI